MMDLPQVELGGRTLRVAPANLKTIKRWLKAQKETRVGTVEYLDEISNFVLATLRIEQPDLTMDWLDEYLTEPNLPMVIAKIYEAGKIVAGETRG